MYALSEARRALAAVDLEEGLAVSEVHSRLARSLRLRDTGQRALAFYLTEMEERRLYQATGHSSATHYAQDRLDLPPRRTRELMAVGRKLLELPCIDRAFCEQRISWSRVVILTKVATPEHETAWLERAEALTCRELALEVRLTRPGGPPRTSGQKGLPEVRFGVKVKVNALTHQKLDLAQRKLSAERGTSVEFAECLDVLAELFLNLEEDGSAPGRTRVSASLYRVVLRSQGDDADAPLEVDSEVGPIPVDGINADGVEARTRSACLRCDAHVVEADGVGPDRPREARAHDAKTPPALRQRVIARDGQRCRCCGSRHRLKVHHIRYRSRGGPTRAWNLITLCVFCHARVHADLLVLDGKRADRITFRDADGRQLAAPGRSVEPAELLRLGLPKRRQPDLAQAKPDSSRVSGAADVRRPPATVDDIPDRVSYKWWRRYAHMFEPCGAGAVRFRPAAAPNTPFD